MPRVGDSHRWSSAARTHVGKVRQINEDAVLDRPDLGAWAVADGLGGHQAGDTASRMVVDALAALSPPAELSEIIAAARQALIGVNQRLNEMAWDQARSSPGSTVAALFLRGSQGAAVWAGDSRVYLLRDGWLRRLSRDHSQAEEMIQSGLLDPQDATNHPASSVLTRAVGADEDLELDDFVIDVFPGDAFLLCSDGLYNEVGEQTITRVLSENDCHSAADQLLQLALNGEARDNISAVTVRVEVDPGDSSKTVINPAFSRRTAKRAT